MGGAMNDYDKKDVALSYFTIGEKFLNLARISSDEIVKSNNQFMMVSDKPISPDELLDKIKWSDLEIGIPVLFNFYHGIELLLKGFILSSQDKSTGHHFSNLIEICENIYGSDLNFIKIVKKHTTELPKNSIIYKFLNENNISIDDWYEALKYPFDKKGNVFFNHFSLKYGGSKTVDFWWELSNTSELLVAQSSEFYHKNFEPTS